MDGIRPGDESVIMKLTISHGEEPEHGSIDTPSTPHREGVGDAKQNSPGDLDRELAIARGGGSPDMSDAAIAKARKAAKAWMANYKISESTKFGGGAGGGPSRKRDHDTMTNASRLADDSGGSSAGPSSKKNPAHDGDNSVQANKFQRILPKSPRPAQPGPSGQGQDHQASNDPEQPHANQAFGGAAAQGANPSPGEAMPGLPVLPFLPDEVLAWLPTSLRVAACNARNYVQAMVHFKEECHRERSGDPSWTQTAIEKDETVLQNWDNTLRAFVEVAIAARKGRQLDHRPILDNLLTDWMNIKLPDPDQPHGDKQLPLPGNMQPGTILGGSPIIMGMNPMGGGSGPGGELSEEIATVMRISSRNESVRQTQNAQLHNLLATQSQAHAQGCQDLQAAHRRAEEAREEESDMMFTLIKKNLELLEKKDG